MAMSSKFAKCPEKKTTGLLDFFIWSKYSDRDLKNLILKVEKDNITLLTTEKDYLRINKNYRKNISYLKITTEIENKDRFVEEIKKFIWKL